MTPAAAKSAATKHPGVDLYGDPLPDGVLCRLGTTRFRRNGWSGQGSTAFLPDGTILSYLNQSFTFWDAAGKPLRTVEVEDFFPTQLVCSQDGRILVGVRRTGFAPGMIGGQPLTLRVWSLPTLERRRDIELQQNIYRVALAIAPDNKVLATLGDSDLDVYDLASGTLQRKFHVPPFTTRWGGAGVPCVAFSPDGESIAYSGRAGYRISLWKWRTEAKVRDLPYTERAASSLVYSPDGKTIAAADDDGKWIRLWDAATGQLRRTITPADLSYQPGLAYTKNGKFLLASSDGSKAVYVFDATTGKCCRVFETAPLTVSDVAVSHDGRQVAVLAGQSLRLWDIGSGRALGGESGGHTNNVGAVAFSPNGSLVATASSDGTVRIWNPRTARQEHVLRHEHLVRAIAFSPDGRMLATSSYEDSVRLWDTASGCELFHLCGHGESSYLALCFPPDGRRLASWGSRGMYLRIWDTHTGQALAEHRLHPSGFDLPDDDDEEDDNPQAAMNRMQLQQFLRSGTFSPDGRYFVWLIRDQYHLFDVLTGQEVRKIPSPPQTLNGEIALSPDGATLATAWYRWQNTRLPGGGVKSSGTLTIALVQLSTGKVSNLLAAGDSTAMVLAFAPDGKVLAAASGDKPMRVSLWEVATGKKIVDLGGGAQGRVESLAFAPDGKVLVAGMLDSTALVWDVPANIGK